MKKQLCRAIPGFLAVVPKAVETATAVQDAVPKVSNMADTVTKVLPQMKVMAKSMGDNAVVYGNFAVMTNAASLGVAVVAVYQIVGALDRIGNQLGNIAHSTEAQTTLRAMTGFPEQAHKMIKSSISDTKDDHGCKHLYFLYHPDTVWYPNFFALMEKDHPGRRFCGYSNDIHTIFAFMLATRQKIEADEAERSKKKQPAHRPMRIHLLIPAYRTIVIADPVQIPAGIGDFVIEAHISNMNPLVHINLPESQRGYLQGPGLWTPPEQGFWSRALCAVGLETVPSTAPRQVLGVGQPIDQDALELDEDGGVDSEPEPPNNSGPKARRKASALKRRHARSHR